MKRMKVSRKKSVAFDNESERVVELRHTFASSFRVVTIVLIESLVRMDGMAFRKQHRLSAKYLEA